MEQNVDWKQYETAMASNEKVTRVPQEGSLLFSSFGSFVINP